MKQIAKIASKETVLWIRVRDAYKNSIQELEDRLKVEKEILKLAEEKAKESEKEKPTVIIKENKK